YAEGRWHQVGRRADGRPVLRWFTRWFQDRCATWEGEGIGQPAPGYPNGTPYPMANGFDCAGCRLEPDRARRERAAAEMRQKLEADCKPMTVGQSFRLLADNYLLAGGW